LIELAKTKLVNQRPTDLHHSAHVPIVCSLQRLTSKQQKLTKS